MTDDRMVSEHSAPAVGCRQQDCNPELWTALIGRDDQWRRQAVRTIRALEQERWYAAALLDNVDSLPVVQRPGAGDALALLGDPRYVPPHYLPEMIAVPAGIVIMGSPEFAEEQPVHRIEVAAFALAQVPVTNAAYAAFVSATGHRQPPNWSRSGPPDSLLNAPVVWVSAHDAEDYCRWLQVETGYQYRLPTEAEWAAAARGHSDARNFPWGNGFRTHCANIWTDSVPARLCAVGIFPAGRGPYGQLDLAGNVWEWCSSSYWAYPYRATEGQEDSYPYRDSRVMHGGSWRSRQVSVRCSARQGEPATDRFEVVGFRLARG